MSGNGQRPIIVLEGVCKSFGSFQALRGIDLTVNKGERVVVCGACERVIVCGALVRFHLVVGFIPSPGSRFPRSLTRRFRVGS